MKQFLTLGLVVVLLLSLSLVAAGEYGGPPPSSIHAPGSEFSSVGELNFSFYNQTTQDKWFSIEKTQEHIDGNICSFKSQSENFNDFNVDYVINDQTYLAVNYVSLDSADTMDCSSSSIKELKGSYLFKPGLFIAVDYNNFYTDDTTIWYNAGYRLNFGDNGYVAISGTYFNDSASSEISIMQGYEADLMYYLNKAKIFAEIYSPQTEGYDPYYMVGGNMSFTDNLTAGLKYYTTGSNFTGSLNGYYAGLTWNKDSFTANLKYGKDIMTGLNYYALNENYQFNDHWSAGITCGSMQQKEFEYPGFMANVSYKTGIINLSFIYNRDFETTMSLQ